MIRRVLALCLLALPLLATGAPAQQPPRAITASGYAYAEVTRATRKDGILHVEVTFATDHAGYAGEPIYTGIAAQRVDALIYLVFGDQTLPLWRENGQVLIPDTLHLGFNYDPSRNPRVGRWQADFVAPTGDILEATLLLPNVGPIGPFPIRDR